MPSRSNSTEAQGRCCHPVTSPGPRPPPLGIGPHLSGAVARRRELRAAVAQRRRRHHTAVQVLRRPPLDVMPREGVGVLSTLPAVDLRVPTGGSWGAACGLERGAPCRPCSATSVPSGVVVWRRDREKQKTLERNRGGWGRGAGGGLEGGVAAVTDVYVGRKRRTEACIRFLPALLLHITVSPLPSARNGGRR